MEQDSHNPRGEDWTPYPMPDEPPVERCPNCGKTGPSGMHFTGMDYGCAAPVATIRDTSGPHDLPATFLEVSGGVGNGHGDEVHLLMRDDDGEFAQGWFRVDELERALLKAVPEGRQRGAMRASLAIELLKAGVPEAEIPAAVSWSLSAAEEGE